MPSSMITLDVLIYLKNHQTQKDYGKQRSSIGFLQ